MMISKRNMMLGGLSALIPGVTFAAGVIRVPIMLSQDGVPIVSVTIGGRGPYRFIVNTSLAYSVIDERLAIELGLLPGKRARLENMGGWVQGVMYAGRDIVFGGSFRQENVALIGVKNLKVDDIDGHISAGLITALPSELDFEAREIRIYDQVKPDLSDFQMLRSYRDHPFRQTYLAPPHMHASPYYFVQAKLDGLPVNLMLDTSFTGDVLLSSDFVERNRLWDKYPDPKLVNGYNLSGLVPRRVVRVPGLDLGGLKREAGDVQLVAADPLRHEYYDGLLGVGILREYTLAFAGNKGVGVKPNAFFGKPWTGPNAPQTPPQP